ncbi:MAG: alpha/beta-hydrolase family protein [Nocardioides sp.]|uniref:alpha/beta hydrolase n=1 Tax=Nocardioides sp. TaxID=35761 RepID=UPI0039E6B521
MATETTPSPDPAEAAAPSVGKTSGSRPDLRLGPLKIRQASLLGALLGAVLMVASVTPSLVPRIWPLQVLLAGVCFLVGYAAGAFLAWVWRALGLPDLPERLRRWLWRVLLIATPVALLIGGWLGRRWQSQQRELLGMDGDASWWWLIAPLLGVLVVAVGLLVARAIRLLGRALDRALSRVLPGRLAAVIAILLTAFISWQLARGVVVDRALTMADGVFAAHAAGDKEGVSNPESQFRSGGPRSDVAWDQLSREGRYFVSSGLTAADITEVTGATDAVEPVRAYVGLRAADSAAERAQLAVKELHDLGGFDRSVLAVAGTTGTGWIDPQPPAALEYVTHGDVAIVTTQYSYLPSWMSYLVDRSRAQENAAELLTAIRVELASMPADKRPQLYVFGESLGAYSTGSAFTSVEDIATTTDGALMIGPPDFEPTWQRIQERRDPGSPIWKPRYQDGAMARTVDDAADLTDPTLTWKTDNRIIYLVHQSDPIVAWKISRREWLDPRGPDIHPRMNAFPVVSWLQGSFDQLGANSVPPGHGHIYDEIVAPAWATILGVKLPDDELAAIEAAVAKIIDPDRA